MKRLEAVALVLNCAGSYAREVCRFAGADPEEDVPDFGQAPPPAPDLGREIAAAHIVAGVKGNDEWCAALMAQWERLTGRAKEGE